MPLFYFKATQTKSDELKKIKKEKKKLLPFITKYPGLVARLVFALYQSWLGPRSLEAKKDLA